MRNQNVLLILACLTLVLSMSSFINQITHPISAKAAECGPYQCPGGYGCDDQGWGIAECCDQCAAGEDDWRECIDDGCYNCDNYGCY